MDWRFIVLNDIQSVNLLFRIQTSGNDPHQEYNNYHINAKTAMYASKDFNIGEKTMEIAGLMRHWFLWMEQWF